MFLKQPINTAQECWLQWQTWRREEDGWWWDAVNSYGGLQDPPAAPIAAAGIIAFSNSLSLRFSQSLVCPPSSLLLLLLLHRLLLLYMGCLLCGNVSNNYNSWKVSMPNFANLLGFDYSLLERSIFRCFPAMLLHCFPSNEEMFRNPKQHGSLCGCSLCKILVEVEGPGLISLLWLISCILRNDFETTCYHRFLEWRRWLMQGSSAKPPL